MGGIIGDDILLLRWEADHNHCGLQPRKIQRNEDIAIAKSILIGASFALRPESLSKEGRKEP